MSVSTIMHAFLDELEAEATTLRNQYRGAWGRFDAVVAKLRQHADGAITQLEQQAVTDGQQLAAHAAAELRADAAQAEPVIEQAAQNIVGDLTEAVTPTPSQPADPSTEPPSSSESTATAPSSSPAPQTDPSSSSEPSTTSASTPPTSDSDSSVPATEPPTSA
jgi:hypothetical protein